MSATASMYATVTAAVVIAVRALCLLLPAIPSTGHFLRPSHVASRPATPAIPAPFEVRRAGAPAAVQPPPAASSTPALAEHPAAAPPASRTPAVSLAAFLLTALTTAFLRRRRPTCQPDPVVCLSLAGDASSHRSRVAPLRASLFDLFKPPRYEEEPEGGVAVAVPEDDAETAALRRTVLPGTRLESLPLALAYDATRDGWSAAAFHRLVDNRGPAILVGKTTTGVLFGAYNGIGWASTGDLLETRNAFLFHGPTCALDDSVEVLARIPGLPAVYDLGGQGPAFGADGLRIPLVKQVYTRSKLRAREMGLLDDDGDFALDRSHRASSALGTYYEARADGLPYLFGPTTRADLEELRVYVAK